jgi:hypothetical protein
MNATDLHLPRASSQDDVGLDVWVLSRLLIGSAALLTFVTFSFILVS